MKDIIPLAAGVSGKGGEPILAGAIHHWSASNWTEAAGNVTAVQDMAGTANLVGGQIMSAFTFSNAYNSDAALVSACNRYGAFWGV